MTSPDGSTRWTGEGGLRGASGPQRFPVRVSGFRFKIEGIWSKVQGLGFPRPKKTEKLSRSPNTYWEV